MAHSVTLLASTFGWLAIPASVVEPVIALSIAWVAFGAIRRKPDAARSGHGTWLTFGFGLVHGLGFAFVLSELGVATHGSLAVPLVAFNLGVEVGQIAIVLLTLPLLRAALRSQRVQRFGVPLAGAALAGCGLFWFVERVVGVG